MGPDPNAVFPIPDVPSICYIKNVVRNPRILIGDYTYYSDPNGADRFEAHVTHHYDFIGDRLIIGRFCAIGAGVEFIMNGANHCMAAATTYPFYIFRGGWERFAPPAGLMPHKGDTVVGNDVWFGQNVTVLPGVRIGDGAIIGANAVVAQDVPPYAVVVGNPARVVRMRFEPELIGLLLRLRWWDWDADRIFEHMDVLTGGDLQKLRALTEKFAENT